MKTIVFSPDYKEKLGVIREWLDIRFGKSTRVRQMAEIKKDLDSLKEFPDQGLSVRAMFRVDSDYEFIYVAHNYIFFYQTEMDIRVVNIYNEREDFMYKLFGIRTTSEETDQYWRE